MKVLKRTMNAVRSLLLVLIAGLSLTCLGAGPAVAQADTFTETVCTPVHFVVGLACLREQVEVSGELHDQLHVTVDARGSFHVNFGSSGRLIGTGLTSGDVYRAVGATRFTRNIILDRGQTVSGVDNSKLVGPGPGDDLYIQSRFHVTRNAGDELVVVRDTHAVGCR